VRPTQVSKEGSFNCPQANRTAGCEGLPSKNRWQSRLRSCGRRSNSWFKKRCNLRFQLLLSSPTTHYLLLFAQCLFLQTTLHIHHAFRFFCGRFGRRLWPCSRSVSSHFQLQRRPDRQWRRLEGCQEDRRRPYAPERERPQRSLQLRQCPGSQGVHQDVQRRPQVIHRRCHLLAPHPIPTYASGPEGAVPWCLHSLR